MTNTKPLCAKWNTGRQYSNDGQPMFAIIHEGRAHFRDVARGIEGSVQLGDCEPFLRAPSDLRGVVMYAYDRCQYKDEGYGNLAAVSDLECASSYEWPSA